jgi:hypothetical protein
MPNESEGAREGARSRLLWLIVAALVTAVGTVIVSLVAPLFSPAASVTAKFHGPYHDTPSAEKVKVWLTNDSKHVSAKILHIHIEGILEGHSGIIVDDKSTILAMDEWCVRKSVQISAGWGSYGTAALIDADFDCSHLNPQQTVAFQLISPHHISNVYLIMTYDTGSLRESLR